MTPAAATAPAVMARDAFARILRAHEACESGGRFVPSARPTTAAAPAGYGRSQLNTSNHVRLLGRLSDSTLGRLGVRREDIAALAQRGAAAQDWYAALVGGRRRADTALSAGDEATIRAIAAKEPVTVADLDVLAERLGARFAASTGLPAEELRFVAATRSLGSATIAAELRQALRTAPDRAAALDAVQARHPTLALARARLGDEWLVRALHDHRMNENRAGWYTRAAMTAEASFDRLQAALRAGGDRLNADHLMHEHLRRALTTASGLDGWAALPDDDRVLLLGQLARLHALSPVLFELAARPAADVAALCERLGALREDPASAGGAALRAFVRAFTRSPD